MSRFPEVKKDVISCEKLWGFVSGVDLWMFEWGNLFCICGIFGNGGKFVELKYLSKWRRRK
jgi:hypothetical protein